LSKREEAAIRPPLKPPSECLPLRVEETKAFDPSAPHGDPSIAIMSTTTSARFNAGMAAWKTRWSKNAHLGPAAFPVRLKFAVFSHRCFPRANQRLRKFRADNLGAVFAGWLTDLGAAS
jgi:hypothetical protein